MRKKYLSALLFGALLVTSAGTFTSCKDYDDDINNLQEQITANTNAIKALEELVKAGKYVSGVAIEGQTITFTFSDGSTTPIAIPEGENGQVVEVKNDELYIDNEPTGIKVTKDPEKAPVKVENGTWWTLGENGEYTNTNIPVSGVTVSGSEETGYEFTIWNEDGKQVVKLPTASSTISKLTVIEDLSFGFISEKQESTAKNPILWGWGNQTDAMKNWKGPKGSVAKDQLMVGVIGVAEKAVEVSPASVDLGAQELALYDSKGNKAPVEVKAVVNSDKLATDGSRAASANGKWNLVLTLDETVNKDNIKTSFDTTDGSKLYALAVNGVVMTGYNIVVNVDGDKTTTGIKDARDFQYPSSVNPDNYLKFNFTDKSGSTSVNVCAKSLGAGIYGFQTDAKIDDLKIGSTTLSITGSESDLIYDAYIELTDADKAGRYEVTVNDMTVTATDKAVQQTIPANIHILDVTGKETIVPVEFVFGTSSVEGETIENQSFVATLNKEYFIVDLGNTFSGLTDEQADKVNDNITWSVAKNGKTLKDGNIDNTYISYFETEEKANKNESPLTMASASTIKKAKFARIKFNTSTTAKSNAETGLNKVTITLKDNAGNEVKKVSTELTFTAPTFDELVTANTEYALWSDGAFTTRMTYSVSASASTLVPMKAAFISNVTDTSKPGYVNIDTNITYTHKYTNASGTEVTVEDKDDIVSENKKLANQLSTEASITILGNIKVTKKFTTNLLSIFEGAKLTYYKDGVATDVAEINANDLIVGYTPADTEAGTKANGLAIEFNKDIKAVNSDLAGNGVGGLKVSSVSEPSANSVKVAFDKSQGSYGTLPNGFESNGFKITGVSPEQGGTLIMKFTDANGVVTEATIKYKK